MANRKSNKKFMLLSAIGIFMVVDHHTFTAVNILGDYIPYNSFFMPMFVFISGYFNKVDASTDLWLYLKKKARNLLLPYTLITVLALVLQQIINLVKLGEIVPLPSGFILYMLERIVTTGSPFMLAAPMWFVITLFSVQMIYALIKKILSKQWRSYAMFIFFCLMHLAAVYIAKSCQSEALSPFLLPLKVMFFLPFLELGIIYRDRTETKHTSLPVGYKLGITVLLLLFNMIRTLYLPSAYDVAFDSLDELSGFTSPFIITPMVSSLVGIFFWLTVVDLIEKPLCESRFVNYMSCNTFWIMGLHITFFNIFNCLLMLISEHIATLPYFDTAAFRESEWYLWEPTHGFKLAYVVIGILGPLGCKYVYDRICSETERMKKKYAKSEDDTV